VTTSYRDYMVRDCVVVINHFMDTGDHFI